MYSHHDEDSDEDEVDFRTPKKRGKNLQNSSSKRARHDTTANVNDMSLFEIVKHGRTAMTAVVDDWIEAYETHRNQALLDLMQFFINAAGCKGVVTTQMVENATEGFQDIIKRMTEEFDEDSGDYPLIASGAQYKKFKSNFCDFVQALVRQCQFQIIYDQVMMDNVLTLLTELSNSQVRAFRHTSTLAAMKLMTGLVNVALQLNVSLDNTQRQYDAEQSKTASKRASEKLDILLQKRRELEEQQTEIEGMLNGIFKGIFVHRYRDYISELRALCMEEIGVWMKLFPKVFLTDSYLKYVGWTLHDKQKEVRMKCLQTLSALYSDNDMTQDLKLFTSRFKNRIVSMSLDREFDVAVLAIKLLTLIHSNCGYDTPVLTDSDCESIYQLVYSCHRPVAVAAAEFLHKQIFANKDENPGYTKRGRKRSPNTPMIINLLLFFIESDFHEHATYLVDSLWDVAALMLKDWDCMSDLLLEEPAKDEDVLDEKQESALVDIMVCAIKQASEGVPPSGRQGYSKKIASRDRKLALEDTLLLTEHFIVTLPNLLKKFQMDQEKVAGLLQIPKYFNLEVYTTNRLEKHLDDLLEQMAIILDKHTASPILEHVSTAYNHLFNDENAIYGQVSISMRNIFASKLDNFQIALAIFKDAGNDVEAEEIYNVNMSLKKLVYMYKFNDLMYLNLFHEVFWIITAYQEKPSDVFEQMLGYAVNFIFYDLVYGLAKVKELSVAPNPGNSDELNQAIQDLQSRVSAYIQHCQFLLVNCPYQLVKEESFISICDLLVIFAPQLLHTYPRFKSLVRRAPESLQHSLIDFVNENIFVHMEDDEDDDAKINALHRRRSLLAGACKLIVFNMINMTLAASIFQQYIRFYTDYGDIIKETISRSRHINKLVCAQTLGLSLMKLFVATVADQGGVLDQSSQEYSHMKELARRFALTFGLDLVKTREAVAELHKNGILFSLKRKEANFNESSAPESLGFLGILVEFSAKLMKQDKKTIVQYLDKRIKPFMLSNQDQAWIPLVTYRSSLMQGIDDELKKRGRKKKNTEEEFEAPATPQSPATFNQQQMSMAPQTPSADIGPPILNSTMIRNVQPNSAMSAADNSSMYYSRGKKGVAHQKDNRAKQQKRKTQDNLTKSPKKPKTPQKVRKGVNKQAAEKEVPYSFTTRSDRLKSLRGRLYQDNRQSTEYKNTPSVQSDTDEESIPPAYSSEETDANSEDGDSYNPFRNITKLKVVIPLDGHSSESDFEDGHFKTLRRIQNDQVINTRLAGVKEKKIVQSETEDEINLDRLNRSIHGIRNLDVGDTSDSGGIFFRKPMPAIRRRKKRRSQQMAGTSQGGNFLQTPIQNQQLPYMHQQQGEHYQGMLSPQQQHSISQQSPVTPRARQPFAAKLCGRELSGPPLPSNVKRLLEASFQP